MMFSFLHRVWERVVRKGDTVIDATCGNGYDTLTLLKMVADESRQGRVYGLDVQKAALESTSSLLEQSVSSNEVNLLQTLFPFPSLRKKFFFFIFYFYLILYILGRSDVESYLSYLVLVITYWISITP